MNGLCFLDSMKTTNTVADTIPMQITRVRSEDWQLFSDLRIEFAESSLDLIVLCDPAFMRSRPAKIWMDHTHEMATHPDKAAFIAWEAAEAVGFIEVNLLRHVDQGKINKFWVRSSSRRRGIGESLLSEAFKFFQASGVAKAALWVRVTNEYAIRYYVRHGFSSTGEVFCLKDGMGPTIAEYIRTI